MKIIINETQYKKLLETVTNNEVICDNCGWSWDLADGGNDPFICHKCGHNNEEKKFIGKKVMVYRNLHKDTFSIQYKSKVILHADYVKLTDVEFRVRPGGNKKVVNEKKKNVHAFVIGNLVDYCEYPCENLPSEPNDNIVTYDPYKYQSFVLKTTQEPVYRASEVKMIYTKNKIFITKE
jgi:ribosomal protein S27AE